uniref:ArfGAP with RhoGAP domain, ankyrin repeat and PH domain 3 n=1 Tax=Echeneis naucrates TaxID=173247 RepID=A0A665UHF8_ECHNA
MLRNADPGSSRVEVKPVPKPRTVFNRRRTAPIHFCPPDPVLPPPRRLSQESICFTVLEDFTSGDTAPSRDRLPFGLSEQLTTPSRRPSPSRSLSLSDAGGLLPPVPPRLNHRALPSVFQGSPPSSAPSSPIQTDTQAVSAPTSCLDSSVLSGSSPSSSSKVGGLEMISNDIYWGTLPGSAPEEGRRYCSQQSAPPTPPRQTPERNRYSVSLLEEGGGALTQVLQAGQFQSGEGGGVSESPSLIPFVSADEDLTISPYASYTSLTERAPPIISGWLDKLSPQGNYVFQKRYVKFDGKNLMYFGSDKDVYPKGVIPLAVIQMTRPAKDNKFEIVTSQRVFVFRTENEGLRRRWVSTLQEHVQEQLVFGRRRFGPGSHCQKHGALELKGTKSKVYAAINTDQIWLHKSEQCFRSGIGITVIEARGSTIRDGKHRSFELITPYKTFSFTAESDREKRDWMEALQESIAETLSDYEVAEKIWSNRSNRICADCKALNPDWASINLCVVICKNCAGQHRGLGTMVSKVQSLKLDTSVWSNEIVQLFIMLGNDRANDFWAARLSVSEELDCDASPEQRRSFITQKYKEGRYRLPHPTVSNQEELLKVRVNIMQPVLHSGFLYKSSSVQRGTLSRKTREDFQKFWCSVDQSLFLYESDRSADPCFQISVRDIVCLGVNRPDSSHNGFIDRFRYTFELYLTSEKLYLFGLETPDDLHSWTKAIGKAATPLSCHCLLNREFERVGLLRYRAMLDPQQWKEAYFVLQKSNLFICPRNDGAAEDIINLNRLQELSQCPQSWSWFPDKKDILVLVERGRTLHLQGVGRSDFSLWYLDIQRAAGGKGNTLKEQQLSRNDIPIIVDSCINFITQYEIPQRTLRLDRYKDIIRTLPRVNRTTLAALIGHLYRVQKCAGLNQMCTKNLSLLFAPSLFQTDGKGEHEVKVVEDLIDNYLHVFDIDEEHQTQIELEISLITSWKDTQLSQAGDLIIEVYLEMKIPDCCITLKVSPTMCAEELTNQVLYMRNVPAGDKDVWMTFEAIEDGQLERPLHPKQRVLEQALQWCKMADPSSAYLVVKRVPKREGLTILTSYHSDTMKLGLLRCREEPPKLLQGNKFQERTFQIKDQKLLLIKDKKSIKPEKEWSLRSMKIYIGIRRKLKAPSRYLCCSSEADLWEWISSFLRAQNDDPGPPVLRRHSSSDICKQKFGTMPLVPIRGDESNSSMFSANQTLVSLNWILPMKVQQDSLEDRSESPDLPEPLYEEVGDFGLQVLRSLETSFLSSSTAETHEVQDHPGLRLVSVETGHLDPVMAADRVRTVGGSVETLEQSGSSGGGGDGEGDCSSLDLNPPQQPERRGRGQSICTPSQELLLQELSSAFRKTEEEEEEEERPYDV